MCMVGPRALVVFKLFSLGWLSLQVTKTHPAVLTTCTTFCETINYDFRLNPNDWSLQTGTLSNVNWKCSIACGRLQALGKSCLGAGRRGIGAVHLGLCAFAQFLKEHGSLNFLVTSILYSIFSVHSTHLHSLWAHHNFAAAFCRPGHTRREIGNSMHAALWYAPQLVFTGEMVWDLPSRFSVDPSDWML